MPTKLSKLLHHHSQKTKDDARREAIQEVYNENGGPKFRHVAAEYQYYESLKEEGVTRVDPHANGYTLYWEGSDGKVTKTREVSPSEKEAIVHILMGRAEREEPQKIQAKIQEKLSGKKK